MHMIEPKEIFQSGVEMQGCMWHVVLDPNIKDTLYTLSDVGGVYKSTDGGNSWKIINKGLGRFLKEDELPDKKMRYYQSTWAYFDGRYGASSFAIGPFDSNHLLLTTGYASSREEEEHFSDGLGEKPLYEKKKPKPNFGELHESLNGGRDWERLSTKFTIDGTDNNRTHNRMLIFDKRKKGKIYLATTFDGIFVSEDNGKNWRHLELKRKIIYDITTVDSNPRMLLAGCRTSRDYLGRKCTGGIYISRDEGERWEEVLGGVNARYILTNEKGWFAACEKDGIYKSVDSGKRWKPVNSGLPLKNARGYYFTFNCIENFPGEPEHLFTIVKGALCFSEDSGESWRSIEPTSTNVKTPGWHLVPEHFTVGANSIAMDTFNRGRIFVCDFCGIWRSDDCGKTWQNCPKGLLNTCLHMVKAHPAKKDHVFGVYWDTGLTESKDGGKTWVHLFGKNKWDAGVWWDERGGSVDKILDYTCNATSVALSIKHPDFIAVSYSRSQMGGGDCVVTLSNNGGKTWRLSELPSWIKEVVIDPYDDNILYAGVNGTLSKEGGFYRSANKGKSWTKKSKGLPQKTNFYGIFYGRIDNSIICHPEKEGVLYIANRLAGVYYSKDRGDKWDRLLKDDIKLTGLGLASTVFHQGEKSIFVGTFGDGIFKIDENGKGYERLNTNLYKTCTALCTDKRGYIYAAFSPYWWSMSKGGILVSKDGGENWAELNCENLPHLYIWSLSDDPFVENKIYAGTLGNAISVITF